MFKTLQLFKSIFTLKNKLIYKHQSYIKTHLYRYKNHKNVKLIKTWIKLKQFIVLLLMK